VNKKEIYEHLASIYLDASSKTSKKKNKTKRNKSIHAAAITVILMVSAITGYVAHSYKKDSPQGQVALFLFQDSAKINFNFDPAKKETFALNLKKLNLAKYKSLGFSVRKTNSKDILSLRVEFINRFDEKSEIYIRDVTNKWIEHRIEFSRFAQINDWSQMKALNFTVEEWNAREKSGIVYIDNIKVLK